MNTARGKQFHKAKPAAVFLLCGLLACLFVLPAYGAETARGACGESLQWALADGTLTVTGSGEMTDFADNQFAPWYEYALEIRAVVLPGGLTHIGSLAFYGCENLVEVTLPESVTGIGSYAFAGCGALRTVRFSQNLVSIGESAFRECASLASLRLPGSLERIGSQAFYRCESLSAVRVPTSVTRMGSAVFAYCYELVRAEVYAQVDTLPAWTFYGCEKLSDVVLSAQTTAAEEYAFQGCDGLNAVYTQTYDEQVAETLREEIAQSNESFAAGGFVATYDAQESSTSYTESADGTSTVTETTQTDWSVVTVTNETKPSGETKTSVNAVVDAPEGWKELADAVNQAIEGPGTGDVHVYVEASGTTFQSGTLSDLAGKDVVLHLHSGSGVEWVMDLSTGTKPTEEYDLNVTVTRAETEPNGVQGETFYRVEFAGKTNFDTTLKLPLDSDQAYRVATLFQKGKNGYEAVQSVVVDGTGVAAYRLGAVDSGTEYYLGIDAEGYEGEALIPEGLYADYGVSGSTLMDENGINYVVTGRSSSWGVSLRTVMILLGVGMLFTVLIVGLVMTLLNKRRSAQAYYASRLAEEEKPLDEEELRLELMREMLQEGSGERKPS